MLGRRRGATVAGDEVEDGLQFRQDAVAFCQCSPILQWYPCACKRASSVSETSTQPLTLTLVFAVSTLHFLMNPLLHLPLQDAGSRRLVEVGYFENVSRIDPVIRATAHDMIAFDIDFVDRDLAAISGCCVCSGCNRWDYGSTNDLHCCMLPSISYHLSLLA